MRNKADYAAKSGCLKTEHSVSVLGDTVRAAFGRIQRYA
jgi:hypothetical protein